MSAAWSYAMSEDPAPSLMTHQKGDRPGTSTPPSVRSRATPQLCDAHVIHDRLDRFELSDLLAASRDDIVGLGEVVPFGLGSFGGSLAVGKQQLPAVSPS